jgi:hypothetical protein
MTGFTAFVVAREYVAFEDGGVDVFLDVHSPSVVMVYMVCGDCFGTAVLLTGFTAFVVAREYIAVEDDDVDVFLDLRSPWSAIVHIKSLDCDSLSCYFVVLCRRYVLVLVFLVFFK